MAELFFDFIVQGMKNASDVAAGVKNVKRLLFMEINKRALENISSVPKRCFVFDVLFLCAFASDFCFVLLIKKAKRSRFLHKIRKIQTIIQSKNIKILEIFVVKIDIEILFV